MRQRLIKSVGDAARCLCARGAIWFYFSQPRFLKYHIGPTALVTISARA